MPAKIPYRNRDRTGWWIFNEVEQWVATGSSKPSARTIRPVWENTRLICARNREEAYRKAMALCRAEHPSKTIAGEWRFAGISMLLPVCEEIAHGSELLWTKSRMTVAKIKRLVKSKARLPVFDDTPGPGD